MKIVECREANICLLFSLKINQSCLSRIQEGKIMYEGNLERYMLRHCTVFLFECLADQFQCIAHKSRPKKKEHLCGM